MQSGKRNTKNWLLEFDTLDTGINPLNGMGNFKDTMSEVKLEFSTKNKLLIMLKKIILIIILLSLKKKKIIKKSYTDNFLKDN